MYNNTTTNSLIQNVRYNYTDNRHFVLCESCFWSATIFKFAKQEHTTYICPACFNDKSISLIPLTRDEVYEVSVRSKGGLEMKFSKLIKSPGY
jgi:Zn finger protein HypA/HybF involved in hydrogenase expression